MSRADYSLVEAIPSRNFSSEDRYRAIREVASGLSELFSVRILHRDLKPGNVLRFQGAWRLSDFGISRDVDVSTGTYTFNGAGSVPYMAPEVWDLRPATAKTDLYALGILAYEVLTGSRPFNGPNAEDYERQHRQEVPPRLQINDGRVSRLITRLLSKDPASRPQDAHSVIEVIDLALRRLDPAREEVAAAAAALASVLSQREAEISESAQRAEFAKQAFAELGAFLEDFAEDMREVFPGASFAVEVGGSCTLHLDAAEIFFAPIEPLKEPLGSVVAACSVQAALPEWFDNSLPTPRWVHTTYPADLICDMIDNRLEWTIGTFSHGGVFPHGFAQRNIAALRAEAIRNPIVGGTYQSTPLDMDGMTWFMRHIFEGLSREKSGRWLDIRPPSTARELMQQQNRRDAQRGFPRKD